MTRMKKWILGSAIAGLSVAAACGGGTPPTVWSFTPEPAGNNCQYGGIKIQGGGDANGNGKLDSSEIDPSMTQYACAVLAEGKTALIKINPLSPNAGANNGVDGCTNGGYEILTGLDKNDDKVLEDNEVESHVFLCNGLNGQNGTNGTNGLNSLVRLRNLPPVNPPGANQCMFGGTAVDSGLDKNLDGILEDSEVQTTNVICSVQITGPMGVEYKLVLPSDKTTCPAGQGGVLMTLYMDNNPTNGVRDPGEATVGQPVADCNTLVTVPGHNSLIKTAAATSGQCPNGGFVYSSGVDINDNGVLDAGEVQNTQTICNGNTGATGATGQNGLTSLMTLAADTVVCGLQGGTRIETGLDSNGNGILDASEVKYTSYVCNGASSLVDPVAIAPGAICPSGGVEYNSGVDSNGDGVLEQSEITKSNVVCNGDSSLIYVTSLSAGDVVCTNGGAKIESGLDSNGNGILDASEVTSTTYVCAP